MNSSPEEHIGSKYFSRVLHILKLWSVAGFLFCGATQADEPALPAPKSLPVVFLIGDSTVKNGTGKGDQGLWGWGELLGEFFNTNAVQIRNRALGGRSSRTYLTEGLWDKVLMDLRPGDYVLMQFGHNDGGSLSEGRARASLKGTGEDSKDVVMQATGKPETVHSYGWYLRRYIKDAQSKGAVPIVFSPIPRNMWKEGKVLRASGDYGKWAEQAAKETGALFINLNELVASRYELEAQEKVASAYFTEKDHTHTTRAGARVNAEIIASALKAMPDCPLSRHIP